MYARRTNMEIEPETEDIDDQKLAQNFYKYHIHPDWLVIRRIINHRVVSGKKGSIWSCGVGCPTGSGR